MPLRMILQLILGFLTDMPTKQLHCILNFSQEHWGWFIQLFIELSTLFI